MVTKAEAAPEATGPILPIRTTWEDVPEYPGFRVLVRTNFKQGLMEDVRSGDASRMQPALSKIILEHNGWRDEDGAPYPPCSDPQAFWDAIPTELAVVLLRLIDVAVIKLPNSLSAIRRR